MTTHAALTPDQLDARWPDLARAAADGGVRALVAAVAAEADDHRRTQLFRLAIRKLGGASGATAAGLDAMCAVGDAAIAAALDAARRQPDAAQQWTDEANRHCYNLAANLCDCWGDGDTRQAGHFAKGLALADEALRLRLALGKGDGPLAMAHWVRGKHLLSLRRAADAADAFAASLAAEERLARAKGADAGATAAAPGSLLLARAFLGLAQARSGTASGEPTLQQALALLELQAATHEGEVQDEARSFAAQIKEAVMRN